MSIFIIPLWELFSTTGNISDPLSVIEPPQWPVTLTLIWRDNWTMATFEVELLAESLHKGRPKDEEPHVKRVPIKKENDSGIEYIVRIDLVCQ